MRKFILFAALFFACTSVHAFVGSVTRVSDGDTIVVTNPAGESVKVRLYGIDTPESRQTFGPQSTRFTANKVLHKTVRIVEKDVDRYGRSVALVYTEDGELLNEKLVETGMAWVYVRYCKIDQCSSWIAMQDSAKNGKVGMWQDPEIIAPWDYRKKKK